MALDLSPTALVNAGGAALFLLVGILILAWGWRAPRARWIGATAAAFGITYVVQNLSRQDNTSNLSNWTFGGLGACVAIVSAGLAVHLARDAPPRERRALGGAVLAIVALCGLLGALRIVIRMGTAPATALSVGIYQAWWVAHPLLLAIACAAAFAAARACAPDAARRRRALVLLGASFGLWAMYVCTSSSRLFAGTTERLREVAALTHLAAYALGPIILLFATPIPDEPKLGRRTFLLLFVHGIVGLLVGLADFLAGSAGTNVNHWGTFGIVRTIGAALLLVAVVKYDLLGVPLPTLAVDRGALAAGALAALFVTAELAQNFLSSQYGLVMGGVVAGVFLFAAHPIQRVIERIGNASRPARASEAFPAAHETYRKALRLALHDGAMTREEERHLADLADDLHVSYRDALALRDEIERELKEAR